MWIAISIILVCMLILVSVLFLLSPGKPAPILDEYRNPVAGSISEKVFVNINGVKQGIFIKSRDATQPVLLYLHGGMPEYFLDERYPSGLENIFTTVWWEQRGSGISYSPDIPRETMNQEQLISDTLEVTKYLRRRFGKEKIYLMAHSGGAFIGIQAAACAPELYYAYIGVAQISYQMKSEKIAYDYMLEQYRANGNTRMARKLEATPVTMAGGTPREYTLLLRDQTMHDLGIGTTHKMHSIVTGVILPTLASQNYTLIEKINMFRGKSQAGVSIVWDRILTVDLSKEVPELAIPVYFISGIYDYTVNYQLSKDYFGKLRAPMKGFYTFEQSAHSPMFEEPLKMQRILREDVLAGVNTLADVKEALWIA